MEIGPLLTGIVTLTLIESKTSAFFVNYEKIYGGGSLSWEPSERYNESFKEIDFEFRLSLSHLPCVPSINGSNYSESNSYLEWTCLSGCEGTISVAEIFCETSNQEISFWSGHFTRVFADEYFQIVSSNCCWMNTSTQQHSTTRWSLSTSGLLGIRNDTMKPNSPPLINSPQTISLNPEESGHFELSFDDADGDEVRCRAGREFDECGDACGLPNGFELDQDSCIISFNRSYNISGVFSLSIIIEDYREDRISINGRVLEANNPLSSVPYQIIVLVEVDNMDSNCHDDQPYVTIASSQLDDGLTYEGELIQFSVIGRSCSSNEKIEMFHVSGPTGLSRGEITTRTDQSEMMLSWTPEKDQLGPYQICVLALYGNGVESMQKCVSFVVHPSYYYCHVIAGNRYRTFDGYNFALNENCRYQLAASLHSDRSTSENNQNIFNITVTNKLRDGKVGLHKIHIEIGDQEIELRKKKIMVNGSQVYPPALLGNVRIEVKGRFISISIMAGLFLHYNGDSFVSLELNHSFMGTIEGLCGNFNGNSADDAWIMNGDLLIEADNPRQMISNFRVNTESCSSNPLLVLRDDISCLIDERLENMPACGLLTDVEGCFAGCQSLVDPAPFHQICIENLCGDDASSRNRHKQLATYAGMCHIQNISVCDWRSVIGAPLECPLNSHYTICGSLNPETCSDHLYDETNVQQGCFEGCECDEGYVLFERSCIARSECGCFIRGSLQMIGFTFRSDNCMYQCTCIGLDRTQCSVAPPCSEDEQCGYIAGGFKNCTRNQEPPATCKIVGDPHYRTFDGASYDSMSTCAHILVRSRPGSPFPPFIVVGINEEPRLDSYVSHVREVQVSLGGTYNTNITLSQGRVVLVNGTQMSSGSEVVGVKFRSTPMFLVVSFNFGLVIRWDGVDRLRITATSELKNQVEGLCGNYDGDPDNDYSLPPEGRFNTNISLFVKSWLVTGTDYNGGFFPELPVNATAVCMMRGLTGDLLRSCIVLEEENETSSKCKMETMTFFPDPCDSIDENRLNLYRESCSILVNTSGPFEPCHSSVDPFPPFSNCIFDLCSYNGSRIFRDRIVSAYKMDCRAANITGIDCRNDTSLDPVCPQGSKYQSRISECEPTCADPNATECIEFLGSFYQEGCKCLDGFVRSSEGKGCIPRNECGCTINNIYQEQGFKFRKDNCTESCECVSSGVVACSSVNGCSTQDSCSLDQFGFEKCVSGPQREPKCIVMGSSYTTFDEQEYEFEARCSYVLVRTCSDPQFSVIGSYGNRDSSRIYKVIVLFGNNMTMEITNGTEVTVNGEAIQPGFTRNGVEVNYASRNLVISFEFGMTLTWGCEGRLEISVQNSLRHLVEGLCGNFDGVRDNDLPSLNGVVQIGRFIEMWEVSLNSSEFGEISSNNCSDVEQSYLNICNNTQNETDPSRRSDQTTATCTDENLQQEFNTRWRKQTLDNLEENFRNVFDSLRNSSSASIVTSYCRVEWTDWLNRDTPGGSGDDERLLLLRREFPQKICESPRAIEARLKDGSPATLSGNNVTMSPDFGLLCNNDDQIEGGTCADFEVRFMCLES